MFIELRNEILVLIVYAQMLLIATHDGLSIAPRSLLIYLKRYLHPFSVYTSSKGSDDSTHMRKLAPAFAASMCDKYRHLERWLINALRKRITSRQVTKLK